MGLPYVVEFLLAQQRPGGSYLVRQGASQTVIPIVPPNTEFILQAFPYYSDFADIIYATCVDTTVIPGAFYGWAQYFGSKSYDGVLTEGFLSRPLETFIFVSESQPALALIRNQTGLNQYYAGMALFLSIASEEDYNRVLETLNRLGTSNKSEQLAQEAVNLLRIMTGEPAPYPPLGGL